MFRTINTTYIILLQFSQYFIQIDGVFFISTSWILYQTFQTWQSPVKKVKHNPQQARQPYCSSAQQWLQVFQKPEESVIWSILCNVKHFYSWDDDINCPQDGSKSTLAEKINTFCAKLCVFPISIVWRNYKKNINNPHDIFQKKCVGNEWTLSYLLGK